MQSKEMFDVVKTSSANCEMGSDRFDVIWATRFRLSVKEFIDYLLENRIDEWGKVYIGGYSSDVVVAEYRHGELVSINEELIKCLVPFNICECKAEGRWTNMDWYLTILKKA